MAKRHICSNIRLVLDVLDYNHFVNSDALILFLDIYKAFDTIDHHFLLQSLHTFGFGNNFIQTVKMFYRGINSSVILQNNTSRRFFINRGVRQGCPISPFLFLIVVELLAISVEKNPNLLGITLFNREIKISQLADDTTLFLKDKNLIKNAIKLVQTFSDASGLQLNITKCEILPVHDSSEQTMFNIPVKECIKYLGIYISIKKTKIIFDNWLRRDLSISGRILLTKVEGLSRLIFPGLSLFVQDSTGKDINRLMVNFCWKNKHHHLKKKVLAGKKSEVLKCWIM